MEAPNANDRLALFQSQVNQMPLDATVDLGMKNILRRYKLN